MADPVQQLPPHQDPQTFPGLIDRLAVDAMLVLIASWMGDRLMQNMTAEDIWQETLYMAWRDRDRHQWQGPRAYRAWLLAIAKNRVRDAAEMMNAQKRGGDRRVHMLSTLAQNDAGSQDQSLGDLMPPDSVTPSRLADHRERANAMTQALMALPEDYREAVRLRLLEQLPLAEVADRLGVSLATAKKRIYLGSEVYRDNLRQVLSRVPGSRSHR